MSFPWKEEKKPSTIEDYNAILAAQPPPRPKVKKDEECFLLADKYARTKKRWWITIGVELDPNNSEPDKLLYERVRRRYRG